MSKEILLPDIGDFTDVEVVEVLVAKGDTIAAEDSMISLESDKAVMEIPAPEGGVVKEVKVKVGDRVSQGSLILILEPSAQTVPASEITEKESSPGGRVPSASGCCGQGYARAHANFGIGTSQSCSPARIDEAGFAKISFSGALCQSCDTQICP